MKKFNFLIVTFIFSYTLLNATNYFVSKNGDDVNSGIKEKPFKTIAKASSVAIAGDTIFISEGSYEETLRPKNSGTSGKPIVYEAVVGEKVTITAMQALDSWTLDAGVIYKTTVGWDLDQKNFVINGNTILDLARWPNNLDGDPFTLDAKKNTGGSADSVSLGAYLDYSSGIPNIDWKNGGSIFFYCTRAGWLAWKSLIKSSTSSKVTFDLNKNPTWIRTSHPPEDLGLFYLEGVKGAIDFQNEWYFDKATKTLYVQLPKGAEPVDGEVKMRKRDKTIDLTDRNYIEIRNLAVFGERLVLMEQLLIINFMDCLVSIAIILEEYLVISNQIIKVFVSKEPII